ncbi:hypothetical protein [Actinoallomurus vinaceus]|uniref:hypothetical protein n=1 Tax=Actinoallomurus vinaceus TaxID=1080074 RepID=UPI0031E7BB2D
MRIVPVSYCEHRVCMWDGNCREEHFATCPPYCRAVGRTPRPPAIQQLDLFADAG